MSTQRHKDYYKNYSEYWETCGERFAHIKQGEWDSVVSSEDTLSKFEVHYGLKDAATVVKGAVVIDYGIGNGRLAIPLLEAGARKYVGIDIADRQLNKARQFLQSKGCKEGYELLKVPVRFADHKPDLFITQACMQHFPNQKFLNSWCENVDASGAAFLLMQYRYTEKGKEFNRHSPIWACKVNCPHLAKLLPSYRLEYVSEVALNGYQRTLWVCK
jgi:SAM-dependent methyltransferase